MASNFTNPNETENNQQNQQEQQGQQAPATQPVQSLAGSSQISSSPSSRVASFSTGQAGTPGSGRFTNLKNYLDANKNATAQFGQRANTQLNEAFGKEKSTVDKANQGLQTAFSQGRSTLDTGDLFKNELTNINQNLSKGFENFGDRNTAFDTASQAASNFARFGLNQPTVSVQPVTTNPDEEDPAPNIPGLQLGQSKLNTPQAATETTPSVPAIDPNKTFESYKNIAQGLGLDESRLQNIQQSALTRADELTKFAKKQLQNVETESGRNDLFNRLVRPKEGYTQGQESLDKLFFGGALGNVKSNLQDRQSEAFSTKGNIDSQGNVITDLAKRESDLVEALRQQSQGAQDAFSNALYGEGNLQRNLDQVNAAREARFQDLASGLRTGGTIASDNAQLLGLDNLNTYVDQYQQTPQAVEGKLQPSIRKDLVGLYNLLNNEGAINRYISQGAQAASNQDITTQQDFDVYNALQNIALGRDLGKVSGVSQLEGAIQAGTAGDLNQLAKDIQAQDQSFRNRFEGKTFGSEGFASGISRYPTLSSPVLRFGSSDSRVNLTGLASDINEQRNAQLVRTGVEGGVSGGSSVRTNPLYINNGNQADAVGLSNTDFNQFFQNADLGNTTVDTPNFTTFDSVQNMNDTIQRAKQRAEERNANFLNQNINTEGARNALQVSATPTASSRFRGLV